jgi:hypothetical protein
MKEWEKNERLLGHVQKAAEQAIPAWLSEPKDTKNGSGQELETLRERFVPQAYEKALVPSRILALKMKYLRNKEHNIDLRKKAAISIAQSAADAAFNRAVNPPGEYHAPKGIN